MATLTAYVPPTKIELSGPKGSSHELIGPVLGSMNPIRFGKYIAAPNDGKPVFRRVHFSNLGSEFFELIKSNVYPPYFYGFLSVSTPNDNFMDAFMDMLNLDLRINYLNVEGKLYKINRENSKTFKTTYQYRLPEKRNYFIIYGRKAYRVETEPDDDLSYLHKKFNLGSGEWLIFDIYDTVETLNKSKDLTSKAPR